MGMVTVNPDCSTNSRFYWLTTQTHGTWPHSAEGALTGPITTAACSYLWGCWWPTGFPVPQMDVAVKSPGWKHTAPPALCCPSSALCSSPSRDWPAGFQDNGAQEKSPAGFCLLKWRKLAKKLATSRWNKAKCHQNGLSFMEHKVMQGFKGHHISHLLPFISITNVLQVIYSSEHSSVFQTIFSLWWSPFNLSKLSGFPACATEEPTLKLPFLHKRQKEWTCSVVAG